MVSERSKCGLELTSISQRLFIAICTLCIWVGGDLGSNGLSGQETSNRRPVADQVSLDDIDDGLANAESNQLEPAVLAEVRKLYQEAGSDLQLTSQLAEESAQFQRILGTADERLAELTGEQNRAAPAEADEYIIPADTKLEQIEVDLQRVSSKLEDARQRQQKLATEPARRQGRLAELPNQISEAEQLLELAANQLRDPAIIGEPAALTLARSARRRTQVRRLEQQIKTWTLEQDTYAATTDLLILQSEFETAKVKRLVKIVEKLRTRQNTDRQRELSQLTRETTAEAKETYQELEPIALANVELAEQLQRTANQVDEAAVAAAEASAAQLKLKSDLETASQRVETVRLSDAMGVMLRQDKAKLNELRKKYLNDDTVENTVQMRVERYRLEDLKTEVDDPEAAADRTLKALMALGLAGDRQQELQRPLVKLFKSRKEMLARLIVSQDKLISNQDELENAQVAFAKTGDEYTTFINENILWIRSGPPIGSGDAAGFSEAFAWIASPANWSSAGLSLIRGVTHHLPLALPWVVFLLALVGLQTRAKQGILKDGTLAAKRSCRQFTPTATTLLSTILKALLWPAILYVVGRIIAFDGDASAFGLNLSFALMRVGPIIFPFEFLRQVVRHDGLADSHFDWQDDSRRLMKRDLDWFVPTATPLVLLVLTLRYQGREVWGDTLGRAATLLLLATTCLVMYRLFRPGGAFFQRSVGDTERPWFKQVGYLWWLVFPGAQLVLLIFSLAGYNYTALELAKVWINTIAMATGLYILYCVALRFFLVRRRRLRYAQLLEQREQSRKAAAEAADQTLEKPIDALPIELKTEAGIDITDVSRQARELTGVLFGLVAVLLVWQIWQDILPATKIFDELKLWPTLIGEDGSWVDSVSLRDLLISLLLFALTFLGVRNVPGMLELLLLKQLPLDAGSRYAVSTIVRYIITVVGVIMALSFLKIAWSNYSWLVAAVSVGLGFGLQEIVANFVSGLILLLERPVRVGDVVTIDGTTGVVSRIQMRATTVTNWDNQELVVPNKDLITGKLMNWTLSSVVNRISIDVGVAYGSDPKQIREIVMGVALANSDVLNDPEPSVCFEEFGDSSLDFKLRCCVTALSRRYLIKHDLNTGIYYALKEAGIEIPFPQRDLHIRSSNGTTLGPEDYA